MISKSLRNIRTLFSLLAVSVLLLTGCNLPITYAPTATATPPPTTTPVPPTETVPALPTPIPPTDTPLPTLTNPSPGTTIAFSTGATAAVATGSVGPGQVISYFVDASEAQPMILILESPHNDLILGVLKPDGTTLLDPAKKWNRWQWLLPKTGRYTVQVIGNTTTEAYTLTIKVAARVQFASGATSITLNGSTVNGYVISYTLYCNAGQTMTVSLNVPATTAHLDVFGIATGLLLPPNPKVNTWTGNLPETQDYIVEVIPTNSNVVNYSLTISVH